MSCMFIKVPSSVTTAQELLGEETVDALRRDFEGNYYMLAQILCDRLTEMGYSVSLLTFRNGNVTEDGGVRVWSQFHRTYRIYTHHSIVLFGDVVLDLQHSNKLFKTADYVSVLYELNPKLRVDQTMSGAWYDVHGEASPVTVARLTSAKGGW